MRDLLARSDFRGCKPRGSVRPPVGAQKKGGDGHPEDNPYAVTAVTVLYR